MIVVAVAGTASATDGKERMNRVSGRIYMHGFDGWDFTFSKGVT